MDSHLGPHVVGFRMASTSAERNATRHIAAAFIVCMLAAPAGVYAQVNVLTNRYDNARTGANLNETILTVGNVNVTQFGKLYSYPVVVNGKLYMPSHDNAVVVYGLLP